MRGQRRKKQSFFGWRVKAKSCQLSANSLFRMRILGSNQGFLSQSQTSYH